MSKGQGTGEANEPMSDKCDVLNQRTFVATLIGGGKAYSNTKYLKDRSASKIKAEIAEESDLPSVWAWCTQTALKMSYPSYFCSGDWLEAVEKTKGRSNNLLVIIVKDDDEILGVLPLLKHRNYLFGTDLRMLGSEFYPDPLGVIAADKDQDVVINFIKLYLKSIKGWDRLFLDWMLEDEVNRWSLSANIVSEAPYRILDNDFDALLSEFKKKKRYNLKSTVKKSDDSGIEFVSNVEELMNKECLDALLSIHKKRSAQRGINSSFSGSNVENLHRYLCDNSNFVKYFLLKLESRIVAVIYGFEYGERFFYYQVSHDPEFDDLSPGSVLLYKVIEDCCARGVKEFNFLQGGESYKKVWAKDSRDLYQCILYNDRFRAEILKMVSSCKAAVKVLRKKMLSW
ncbi:GNAT family N-acetyltransferase [Marinobacter sp. R17]|uniref:GNAT family N-acetyltransferase n=1 Tax=Marinobacter sp. R17 TaxID=2484250 RepID=UPI000F4B1682|nr:GNAT family N-acetyltransferase [Marinobacter sp. R17]ROT98383.1 GNAT family N-acetyltransferase [Marinobacter sp. R17]